MDLRLLSWLQPHLIAHVNQNSLQHFWRAPLPKKLNTPTSQRFLDCDLPGCSQPSDLDPFLTVICDGDGDGQDCRTDTSDAANIVQEDRRSRIVDF